MRNVIINIVHSLVPDSVYARARNVYRRFRSVWRSTKRIFAKKWTKRELAAHLHSASIRAGDIIMVHSAMSRLGKIDGGATTVIGSLIDVVGADGTVMMPCYGSAQTVLRLSREGRVIDLREVKSNTGIITETFRSTPGTVRSSHPFSSVCVYGKNREYIVSQHAVDPHICHSHSPLGRTLELNAKIIGLGVPISVGLGVMHVLEDEYPGFPFEVHAPPFTVTYIDAEGNPITRQVIRCDPQRAMTRIDHPEGLWILEKFTDHFTRRGIIHWFTYGSARSWVMQTVPLYNELRRLADKGITGYLTRQEWLEMNGGDESIDSW